jgi:hypothetical protein
MNIIKKHWALIGFILAFALDTQFGLLESLIGSEQWVNVIRGLGAIILAYFWQTDVKTKSASIGGGGIKNPKKP